MTERFTGDAPTAPIGGMHALIGELNTEARCVAITATPPGETPVPEINEGLRKFNAFSLVGQRRFNVHALLSSMPDELVRSGNDSCAQVASVIKNSESLGSFATGLAGSLLRYSHERGVSLRMIIGEKRSGKNGEAHSTHSRLGVLAAIAAFSETGEPFTTTEVAREVESYGVDQRTARAHVWKLTKQGLLTKGQTRKRSLEVFRKPDGTTFADDINELFRIIGRFSLSPAMAIAQGTEEGRDIIHDSNNLPLLVERSYASSTHTGKSTPHTIRRGHSIPPDQRA